MEPTDIALDKKLTDSHTARTSLTSAVVTIITLVIYNIRLPASLAWLQSPEMATAIAVLVLSAFFYIIHRKKNDITAVNSLNSDKVILTADKESLSSDKADLYKRLDELEKQLLDSGIKKLVSAVGPIMTESFNSQLNAVVLGVKNDFITPQTEIDLAPTKIDPFELVIPEFTTAETPVSPLNADNTQQTQKDTNS